MYEALTGELTSSTSVHSLVVRAGSGLPRLGFRMAPGGFASSQSASSQLAHDILIGRLVGSELLQHRFLAAHPCHSSSDLIELDNCRLVRFGSRRPRSKRACLSGSLLLARRAQVEEFLA